MTIAIIHRTIKVAADLLNLIDKSNNTNLRCKKLNS